MLAEMEVEPKLLCIELPEELLHTDADAAAEILSRLRETGVRTMLSSFGGDFSPVMRLPCFPLDFVYLDESVAKSLMSGQDSQIAASLSVFELVDSLESSAIATNVKDEAMEQSLPENCILFTGKLAGRTKKITAIRS